MVLQYQIIHGDSSVLRLGYCCLPRTGCMRSHECRILRCGILDSSVIERSERGTTDRNTAQASTRAHCCQDLRDKVAVFRVNFWRKKQHALPALRPPILALAETRIGSISLHLSLQLSSCFLFFLSVPRRLGDPGHYLPKVICKIVTIGRNTQWPSD